MSAEDLRFLGIPVDLNLADPGELESLVGVGPRLAERIVAARPLADLAALEAVKGVGPKLIARNRARLRL